MELIFYETVNGRCPVADFLDGLSIKMRKEILVDLETLMGPLFQDTRVFKKLTGSKLWEFRYRAKGMQFRILCGMTRQELVLLHAFQKQTQKLPRHEIEIAEQRFKDYISRR